MEAKVGQSHNFLRFEFMSKVHEAWNLAIFAHFPERNRTKEVSSRFCLSPYKSEIRDEGKNTSENDGQQGTE